MATGHDPGGQLNLFDVLTVAVALGSGALALLAAMQRFGWFVAVVAAIAAAIAGAVAVQFLTQLKFQSFVRSLHTTPTQDLWTKLKTEYFISHLIVPILINRGESRQDLREYTLALLASDSSIQRWHGWRTLNLWFPETAAALAGTNPLKPTHDYFERIRALRDINATPAPPNSA